MATRYRGGELCAIPPLPCTSLAHDGEKNCCASKQSRKIGRHERAATMASGRDCRGWLWRIGSSQEISVRKCPADRHRPHELSPLSAAVVPGRDGGAFTR